MVGNNVNAVFSRVSLCTFDQMMPGLRPFFCEELQRKQVKGGVGSARVRNGVRRLTYNEDHPFKKLGSTSKEKKNQRV